MIDFATSGEFEDEVDLLVVPEEAIEPAYILMSEMALDLNLSSYLVLILGINDLLDVHDLKSNDELGLLLSGKIDMAELTSAHWLSKFEVIHRPLLRIEPLPDWFDDLCRQLRIMLHVLFVFMLVIDLLIFFSGHALLMLDERMDGRSLLVTYLLLFVV